MDVTGQAVPSSSLVLVCFFVRKQLKVNYS